MHLCIRRTPELLITGHHRHYPDWQDWRNASFALLTSDLLVQRINSQGSSDEICPLCTGAALIGLLIVFVAGITSWARIDLAHCLQMAILFDPDHILSKHHGAPDTSR